MSTGRPWDFSGPIPTILEDAGKGISCLPDLDPTFTLRDCFAESMVKRITTPRGSLFWAPDYGIDIREVLLARIDARALRSWEREVAREVEKDDRVADAQASLSFDAALERLSLSLEVDTKSGPYRFQIAVTSLSVELLSVE